MYNSMRTSYLQRSQMHVSVPLCLSGNHTNTALACASAQGLDMCDICAYSVLM